MELLQLRYFLMAARYENLTHAAEDLHIAQPALSQSIMRLETELGVKLFDRRNHRVQLNEQGKLLEKRLYPLLESIDSLKDELWESLYSSKRTIHLNFLAASPFVTKCIIAYREKNPDVKFQVSQLEMENACDIHVGSFSASGESGRQIYKLPEGAIRQEVLQEEIFLAVPKLSRLSKVDSVSLRDMEEEDYIRLSHSWQLRDICDSFCRRAGIRPHMVFESNSPEAVRNLIEAGLGIGFWPEKAWGGPPGPLVKLIHISYPVCRRNLIFTMFKQAQDKPVVEDFMNFLCRYFENPEGEWEPEPTGGEDRNRGEDKS